MKGLLLKDLYTIKGFGKQYALVLLFMIVWSVFMKTTSFAAMYAMLLGGMLVLTTMSTDEAAHFNQFALTMPVNTGILVKAKYTMLLISIGGGMIIGMLLNKLTLLIPFFQDGFDTISIIAIGSVFLVTYAITLPIIYRRGIEKARYAYIVVLLALAGVIIGGVKLASLIAGVPVESLPSPSTATVIAALLITDVVSFILSYLVSRKILAGKEW